MSQKYFDRLLTGSGTSNKEVKSKFGLKMMEKMGWNKGAGLGKNLDGMTECIQIERRDEGQALGATSDRADSKFKWNDAFWNDLYNSAAQNLNNIAGERDGKKLVSSDESDSDSSVEIVAKKKGKVGRSKGKSSTEDSDSSDFDGDIVIEKSKSQLLTKAKNELN